MNLTVGRGDSAVLFTQLDFGRDHPYFVHLKGIRQGASDPQRADRVNIVTGPCLFSDRALSLRDSSGRELNILGSRRPKWSSPLTEVCVDAGLSIYEHESILRQSRAAADVAASVAPSARVVVNLDVPRVQYYFHLLGTLADRYVSPELLDRWFRLVDLRHAQVVDCFRRRLDIELGRACPGRKVLVRVSAPLAAVEEYIRSDAARGRAPVLQDLVDALAQGQDHVWKMLLDLESPRDLSELGVLSYIVEELRAAGIHEGADPTLAVMVENYPEWKVFHRAQRLLRRLVAHGWSDRETGPHHMVGMYPLERMFSVDATGDWAPLYFNDPGRHARDEKGDVVDLKDAVSDLYRL
ncbi:hypothetical protein OG245_29150 [Streptomyces sp. NBC_01116]|uniref:hypothetical protein n=1 Tax=Streptomyces sp. NBC_01116 TaxID=2903752 RepID=UPI0032545834